MRTTILLTSLFLITVLMSCKSQTNKLEVEVYETSASGHKLTKLNSFPEFNNQEKSSVIIFPENTFQTITGFGGSFTEASAYLLNQLSPAQRSKILRAYFAEEGAQYSLTRTHMSSCDFSLSQLYLCPC